MLPCLFAESLKPCADAEVDGAIDPWTGWASAFADSLLSLNNKMMMMMNNCNSKQAFYAVFNLY